MVEVFRWIMSHSKFFHQSPGCHVFRNGERHQTLQPQPFKGETNHLARPLRSQAFSPIGRSDPPPNLDAGSEVRLKGGHVQTDKTDQRMLGLVFCREESKSPVVEMTFNAVDQLVAFFAGEAARKEFHHARVRIKGSERLPIGVLPSPKQQSFRF